MYDVTLYVDFDQFVHHVCYIFAGFCELARTGEIRLRFERADRADIHRCPPGSVYVQARVRKPEDDRPRLLTFDLKDQSDIVEPTLFKRSDMYFKRSFYLPDLLRISRESESELRSHVAPLGITYRYRAPGAEGALLYDLFRKMLSPGPRHTFGDLRSGLKRFYDYLRTPGAPRRIIPVAERPYKVLFQTRLWECHEVGDDDLEEVNLGRVRLIRRLRKEFGDGFVGGLVPTAAAIRDYPNLVCQRGYRRRDYLDLISSSVVGVSTRGLFHSTPCKIVEYLAAGVAIVTAPIRNELPSRRREQHNLVSYRSDDECIAACVRILDTPGLAAHMSEENLRYYHDYVDPASVIRRCLDVALSAPVLQPA